MNLSHTFVWRKLREHKILAHHKRVADTCTELIASFRRKKPSYPLIAKMELQTERIIWQYWAQGYDDVPAVVRRCLESVEKWAPDYLIIRLSDQNLHEYIDIPEFVAAKRKYFSFAHFSDLLRLMLLTVYGGIWMDATILLSGPLPEEYIQRDFFVFRRDPTEPHISYWRNTYAYYFGWAKGFRVNMLNSFIVARKASQPISDLCSLMLLWWEEHNSMPDYFFFQILCDVYGFPADMPLVSDTRPHYLQQFMNDSRFTLLSEAEILRSISIHKLTYK